MAFKVFLDANFLLDLTLDRANAKSARDIMQAGIDGEIRLHTTPAVLHITAYFTSQTFTAPQTRQIIQTLLNDVRIIDCDHATAVSALAGGIEDIEDALQYYTAIKFDMNYFVSSDKKLKKQAVPQLMVGSATELLALLKK